MNTISGIYRITNTITNDFYIGSSKNVKQRLAVHKCQSTWNNHPNNPIYNDMKKYGTDKFVFEILAEVEIDKLKEKEQQFIETLKPTYNNYNAKGWDIEKFKECQKRFRQSEKGKECQKRYRQSEKGKECQKKCQRSEKRKKYQKKYQQSEKCKEYRKKYNNQLCFYNNETLTLKALSTRFKRRGIINPTAEAKKYLLE